MFLLAIWWGWTPYTLTPGVQGAQKERPGGVLEPQPCILVKTLSNKSCMAPQN